MANNTLKFTLAYNQSTELVFYMDESTTWAGKLMIPDLANISVQETTPEELSHRINAQNSSEVLRDLVASFQYSEGVIREAAGRYARQAPATKELARLARRRPPRVDQIMAELSARPPAKFSVLSQMRSKILISMSVFIGFRGLSFVFWRAEGAVIPYVESLLGDAFPYVNPITYANWLAGIIERYLPLLASSGPRPPRPASTSNVLPAVGLTLLVFIMIAPEVLRFLSDVLSAWIQRSADMDPIGVLAFYFLNSSILRAAADFGMLGDWATAPTNSEGVRLLSIQEMVDELWDGGVPPLDSVLASTRPSSGQPAIASDELQVTHPDLGSPEGVPDSGQVQDDFLDLNLLEQGTFFSNRYDTSGGVPRRPHND